MTTSEQIKAAIEAAGGLTNFSAAIRRDRPINRPMKRMMRKDLQDLSNQELNVAWHLKLIGNAGSVKGSIVANSKV